MDFTLIGILGVVALLALLAVGLPISIDFLVVGFVGTMLLLGLDPALSLMGETMYYSIASPTFCVLPLFILMGSFAARGGFAKRAYQGVHIMAARIPASLAIATSFGCAVFGSICGSSLATATVFGRIAYPEMMKYNYDKTFALGSIACSGTFACMIPPSGMFILFAIFTEQSVGKLFIAGIIPGLITACVYAISMFIRAKIKPQLAPVVPEELQIRLKDRMVATTQMFPIFVLSAAVIGGMYTGMFTPTEAGAVGALGTLIFGHLDGKLRKLPVIQEALRETAHTTAMLFFIIITALFFSRFLAVSRIPILIAEFIQGWEVNRYMVLAIVIALWFILGMLIVQAAVFALTLPILFPIIVSLGFDPIWFCVVAMKLNEIAGVTPPVGLNCYGLAGATGENTRIEEVFAGVWPFVLCDLIVLALLIAFPSIITFLPATMMGN